MSKENSETNPKNRLENKNDVYAESPEKDANLYNSDPENERTKSLDRR